MAWKRQDVRQHSFLLVDVSTARPQKPPHHHESDAEKQHAAAYMCFLLFSTLFALLLTAHVLWRGGLGKKKNEEKDKYPA
jgi:hypothetical protein